MRFPMNPNALPDTIAFFRKRFASANAVARVVADVRSPRTISSNGMMLAGTKKCKPTNRSGRLTADASLSMSRVQVFVARIASGPTMASSLRNASSFTSSFSTIASMTRSDVRRASTSACECNRAPHLPSVFLREVPLAHPIGQGFHHGAARALYGAVVGSTTVTG